MSWMNDKIRKIGEFTAQGEQTANKGSFYLFLAPKSGTTDTLVMINAKVAENEDMKEIPLVVGTWNPIVLSKANLSSDNISKFRIFWGAE